MKHPLAHAIGNVVATKVGLSRLILPRTLPTAFRREVADAINKGAGQEVAFVVGDSAKDGEITSEQAIALRSPESSTAASVVLVSTAAHFRELKSLETYRDLLVGGVPGLLNKRESGSLNADELCRALARIVGIASGVSADERLLTAALLRVFDYLAAAYESVGNAEVEWAEAMWQHFDQLASRLSRSLLMMRDSDTANSAVFAAASLPRPTNSLGEFAVGHDANAYHSIIRTRWDRVEDIQRAVDDISVKDSADAPERHPILALDWVSFPTSRVLFRHPILAVASHGPADIDLDRSLAAWAGTSEDAFFVPPVVQDVAATLQFLAKPDDWQMVGQLPWDSAVFVTPRPHNVVEGDGTLIVGEFRALLTIASGMTKAPGIKLGVRPKTAAVATLRNTTLQGDQVLVEFELKRRLPKKVGSWKEKPFVVELSPTYAGPNAALRETIDFTVLVPHPSRPTVLVGETKTRGGKTKLRLHSDTSVQVDAVAREVRHLVDPERSPDVQLESDRSSVGMIVLCSESQITWDDGTAINTQVQIRDLDDAIGFQNVVLPDEAVVVTDGFEVAIKQPTVEAGWPSPIVAAATREPLIAAQGDFLKLLERDPRATLERWYAEQCVAQRAKPQFRSSLGIAVLTTDPTSSTGELGWNEQTAVSSDMAGKFNFRNPGAVKDAKLLDEFWAAFDRLKLVDCAVGSSESASWPSALDLQKLERDLLERYLSAYCDLLSLASTNIDASIVAYPLSVGLFDSRYGETSGFLLSPLHPLRLAWNWSVQNAAHSLAGNEVYGEVATAFLRFADGEKLPLLGPEPGRQRQLLSLGLSSGPQGFFSAWSMLASLDLHRSSYIRSITLLGRQLPLSAPSGLDRGGVTAALRDYLRVYPSAPQLRIALSASTSLQRSPDIDDAVLSASSNLILREPDRLPGGVRVFDSERRGGAPPDANSALRQLQLGVSEKANSSPAFEWTSSHDGVVVDLQFLEDSLVDVDIRYAERRDDESGCTGPPLPINRFNVWDRPKMGGYASTACASLRPDSYEELKDFQRALACVEVLSASQASYVEGRLRLGKDLLGRRARWTITGNRNLDPSLLSEELREHGDGLALWEWRPAFLGREQKKDTILGVSSSHPYTVLARPSEGFLGDLVKTLADCTGRNDSNDAKQLLGELGIKGVGLSSLLTMGHTQSVGAVGFFLAFKSLLAWEADRTANEVRFVVPLDAMYPLIDVLAVGGKATDAQRRADLLLFKADLSDPSDPNLWLHPIEIKMRTSGPAAFPGRGDKLLDDPLDQLRSSRDKIERMVANYNAHGKSQTLVTAAVATLIESALALRPNSVDRQPSLDLALIAHAACGRLNLGSSNGTILWFRKDGHGRTGSYYEPRAASDAEPGVVLVNPQLAFEELIGREIGEVRKAVISVVESSFPRTRRSGPRDGSPTSAGPRPPVSPAAQAMPANPQMAEPATPELPRKISTVALEVSDEPPIRAASLEPFKIPEPQITMAKSASDEPPVPRSSKLRGGIDVLVGEGSHDGKWSKIHFRPSNTSLNQLNIGVVGDLGTGKTQFLQSLVYQLTNAAPLNRGVSPKMFIFDYKQDYTKPEFSEAINAQVLDPAIAPIPINFFALPKGATRVEKVRRAHFFRDVFRRIVSIGAVQANALYESVMRAYEDSAEGHAPTIDDILDVYRSRDGTREDSVVSQLKLMVDLEIFEKRTANTTNFEGLFSRNTVLSLRNIGAGQEVVDIIVSLFLDLLYNEYMIKRPKMPFVTDDDSVQRRFVDSFVLVDEAHHIMSRGFDVLMNLLLEGREFGMGVILSSQYLTHFKEGGKNWAEALSTWVVHKIRAKAKEFEEIGFRRDARTMEQEIGSIERHWAYYRCSDGYNEGTLMKGQPFFSLKRD